MRILIINDRQSACLLCQMRLQQFGFHADYAKSSLAALELLEGNEPYDAIVQDVVRDSGEVDESPFEAMHAGYDFYAEHVKASFPSMPVVFWTAVKKEDFELHDDPRCFHVSLADIDSLPEILMTVVDDAKKQRP